MPRQANELLFAAGLVEIQAAGGDGKRPPRVSIVAYTGGVMQPPGWPALVIDLAGAEVGGDVPILAGHREDLDAIAGQGKASIRDHQLHLDGTLTDATAAGLKVIALGRSGVNLQASVGYVPTLKEYVSPGQTVRVNGRQFTAPKDGLTLIRAGKLREVSLLPIGADPNTSVSISAKGRQMSVGNEPQETNQPDRRPDQDLLPENQPNLTLPERIEARFGRERWHDPNGAPAQRARKAMIRAAAGAVDYASFLEVLLQERLNDAELALIHAERPRGPQPRSSRRDIGSPPLVLEAALLKHLGHEGLAEKALGANVIQAAAELGCASMLDICRSALQLEQRDLPQGRDAIIRAAFSTTSLSGILGNAANKLLLDAYTAFPSVARIVAKRLSANDFKTHTGYRLTGDATFKQVAPSGEIQHGTLAEASFTFSIATYGRMFGLNRQEIINDDLGSFDSIPQMIGRGAAVALEDAFWTLVLANTSDFFGTGNANLIAGTDTVLAIEGLRQAVQAMRQQVDSQSVPIFVQPKYLVVPPELEATADQLYVSTNLIPRGTTDAVLPDSNWAKGKYQPLVAPHLSNEAYTGYSATAWYLFGLPADVAAFGIAYLNGVENPTVESQDAEFNTLGVQYRGYLDFGVCQIDHRGAVKATGEAE